jgi:hypothetical protein
VIAKRRRRRRIDEIGQGHEDAERDASRIRGRISVHVRLVLKHTRKGGSDQLIFIVDLPSAPIRQVTISRSIWTANGYRKT